MAGGPLGQLAGQLHPLGLAARQGGGGLAQAHVAQAHVHQGLHVAGDGGLVGEELEGVGAGHVQHVGDVAALEVDLEGVAVVAAALAHLAGHVHVGQEVHLDLDGAVALAGVAAAPADVEGEPAGHVSTHLRLRGAGEELADVVEDAGVGGRVGPGGAADGRLVDGDDLVEASGPVDADVAAGRDLRPVDALHQGPVQDLVDQRRLARARHAGDAGEQAEGELDVDVGQVVLPGAPHGEQAAVAGAAAGGHLDAALAGQILAGDRLLDLQQLGHRAGADDAPAVLARAGADVHHVVGGADGLLVVLHHQHGVAQVPHPHQGLDQALVVPLVQADGGLVQHVEHPHQAGADLAGQPDALGLAAGQGGGAAGQVEVVEAHVEQEPEPRADLLEHLLGDHGVAVVELQLHQGLGRLGYGHRAQLVDAVAADGDGQRHGVEPGPGAVGAGDLAHVALDLLSGRVALGVLVAAHQVGDHALELGVVDPDPVEAVAVADLDPALHPPAVEQQVLLSGGEEAPGLVLGDVVGVADRLHQSGVVAGAVPGPRRDGPFGDGGVGVGHHQLGIDLEDGAEAVAVGAGPVGGVEGEVAGGQLLEGLAVGGPGKMLTEHDRGGFSVVAGGGRGGGFGGLAGVGGRAGADDLDLGHPVGQAQGGLHRVGEPALEAGAQHQPVHHHADVVHLVAGQVEPVLLAQLDQVAVDDGPGEPLGGQVVEQGVVGALAAPHHRGQDLEAGALVHGQDAVHDLLGGLADEALPGLGVVGDADAGVEQAQVVVHLGDGAHGGPGVAGGALLVDGDGRRQALDEVDVGLVHLAQELAGVGRQRLHVAPLALGVDGVEGQRALPRPRQPREHDQPIPGQVQVDVPQVVLPSPGDDQTVSHADTLATPTNPEHTFDISAADGGSEGGSGTKGQRQTVSRSAATAPAARRGPPQSTAGCPRPSRATQS